MAVVKLVANEPNQVWSWDISKLAGPAKWTWFYLFVIIDIYSRYVPGWMLAHTENAELAKELVSEALRRQGIGRDALTLHSDRGSPMTAKPFVFMLADLGVTKSYSRPHTSNDNPYSESAFRTAKYRPDYPDRFGCFEDAHAWCGRFFGWSRYAGDPPTGRWGRSGCGHHRDRRVLWRSCRAWSAPLELPVR